MSARDDLAIVLCRAGRERTTWDGSLAELSARHRVVVWRPPRGERADPATDLAQGLARHGIERAHLVAIGHACGAAARAARTHPQVVASLTLSANARQFAMMAEHLGEVRAPILLVIASADAGHRAVRRLLATAGDARLAAIPRARSSPDLEATRPWGEAVLDFIGYVTARPEGSRA